MQAACPAPDRRPQLIEAGTPAFVRTSLAMFAGGFATFAMLYATQPVLPKLAAEFAIAPAQASLSVSIGTAALAAMLIPASVLSDRIGRRWVMRLSLALATLAAAASAIVTDFTQMLVLRMLLGAVLAGLPASALAYLGEEVAPGTLGRSVGLYIGGNALGGMTGRFLVGWLTDLSSWRIAFAATGVLGLIATIVFWLCLPESRHFRASRSGPLQLLRNIGQLFADTGLRSLFVIGFLLMGTFTSLYNYLGFRLHLPPFSLGQTAIGGVFLLYMVGSFSSAWTGQLVDRLGRRQVLWVMILGCGIGLVVTLADNLAAVLAGVAIFTFGYFGAHTTASGWVSRRAAERRALAAAVYLSSYYLGGSVIGTLSGFAWQHDAWPGVATAIAVCVALALVAAWHLRHLLPVGSAVTVTSAA
ncbi:MFS transporter [Azoarcus sp. KH32C]|uniref:MFS transporter n=1 Tax=Azoarcus sp. KH32C TaxID=748247 RepID=UPI0002386FEC|nr:MFS transporter [Azoarcus sp. KH32C]BAL23969.1 putative MFS transporter [Azoarcus sp. KH32C]